MGRRKKILQLTQEQIDWRNSILRKKISTVKKAEVKPQVILTDEDKIRKCFFFLNNCVFWINEYIDGMVDKKRLLETAIALQSNGRDLEKLLRSIGN